MKAARGNGRVLGECLTAWVRGDGTQLDPVDEIVGANILGEALNLWIASVKGGK